MHFHQLEQRYQYLEDKRILTRCSDGLVWDKLQRAYHNNKAEPHLNMSDLCDLQDMLFRMIGAIYEAHGFEFGHKLPADANVRSWYKNVK